MPGMTIQAQRIAAELRARGLRQRSTRRQRADFRVRTERVRRRDRAVPGGRYTEYGPAWAYITTEAARRLVADEAPQIAAVLEGWVALIYADGVDPDQVAPSSAHVYSDYHRGGQVSRTIGSRRQVRRGDGSWS